MVAAKTFDDVVLSTKNKLAFVEAMSAAASLRHPNIVKFVGASLEKEFVIFSELMSTNLNAVMEHECLIHAQIITILTDVLEGLNYLHQMHPNPVIHKDVCDTNVLLNHVIDHGKWWSAKLSDCTLVDFLCQIDMFDLGKMNYVAPEFGNPALHTTKMDVYSAGVLFKIMSERNSATSLTFNYSETINVCMDNDPSKRPTAKQLLELVSTSQCLFKQSLM